MLRSAAAFALLLITLSTVPAALAQAPDDSKPPLERTPEMEAAEVVGLAASLASYGRRTGSPHALVAAAALLLETPVSAGRFEDEAEPDDNAPSLDPGTLLDEAEALAAPDDALRPQIAALRDRAPEAFPPVRGAERGPILYAAAADGQATRQHTVTFRGRENATFHLVGDGSSDLDYYLYDINGELVASSDGPSDQATLIWYVPYRQRLTLRVRNRGRDRNGYQIVTN